MSEHKDYYSILGVSRNATPQEIKEAYKKLAKAHHPDMVADMDKAQAEKRFKEINEAYQVLSDPQKKQMYDRFGTVNGNFAQGAQGGFRQNGPFTYTYTYGAGGANPFGDVDPFDIFEEIFGFRGYGRSRQPRKGKNLAYEMHIDFADAIHGAEKEIHVESGKVKVKIPKGVRTGTEVRYAGKGMPGPQGLPPGDLYITFRVRIPKEFERSGDNLATKVDIDFVQATLGDEVQVPVIDPSTKTGIKKQKMKIPQGTQPGTIIRLKGKGMPRLKRSGQGDLFVKVNVTIPKRLSKEQRRLLEEYRKTKR